MKTAVIYQSHYGNTKKYAQWIAEALGASLFKASEFSPGQAKPYDQIIFGGALYAGHIADIELITKNPDAFAGKKLIIFVSGMSPHPGDKFPPILAQNKVPQKAACFYVQGAMDTSKLGFLHSLAIAFFRSLLWFRKRKDPFAAEAFEAFKKPCDFVSKDAIEPLLEEARKNS